ncbi:MAG: hypothetical protein MJ179_11105 [Treponema sp.]|nr:hypothetical protein [Treponema sp.]
MKFNWHFHTYEKLFTGFFIVNFSIIYFLLACFRIDIPAKPYFIISGIASFVIPSFISENFYDHVEENSFVWKLLYFFNLLLLGIVMLIYIGIKR